MNKEIAQIRQDLLAWAGLHRGKAIDESAMPRFHELIDRLEQVALSGTEQDDSWFWQQLGQTMVINRRRAVFAKLSEVLKVPVDSDGNAVIDGKERRFSFEEAMAIVAPHWKISQF
jgi:hypothetical protein